MQNNNNNNNNNNTYQHLPTPTNKDPMERIVKILSLRKEHEGFLDLEDFRLLVESVLETHPGLEFLADSPEFGDRYVQTVLYRIFYVINASNTGRITARELRKSNFVKVLHLLDAEDDINKVTDYFSYRHFYVIYTSFWKPVFETREPRFLPNDLLEEEAGGVLRCSHALALLGGRSNPPVFKRCSRLRVSLLLLTCALLMTSSHLPKAGCRPRHAHHTDRTRTVRP